MEEEKIDRRGFIKKCILVSGALTIGSVIPLTKYFFPIQKSSGPNKKKKIANVDELPVNSAKMFSYPVKDPSWGWISECVLIHLPSGEFKAYSANCTHLRCIVEYKQKALNRENVIYCPCHAALFNPSDGSVISGPPPRPLPEVLLEIDGNGDIYAVDFRVPGEEREK